MGEKTKEQLLDELTEVQKMLEKRTKIQGQMIRELKLLIANELLFSQIIDFFPYPIAIFTPEYTLAMVNKAFSAEAERLAKSPEESPVKILQYKIDNIQLASAVKKVFAGYTFFIEDLKDPFSMFSGIEVQSPQPGPFNKAVIFPVSADDVEITHGVIVFMP
jgi:hypothetical protein